MNEPTRKLPDPTLDKDGCWHGQSCLSPESFKVRGALPIRPTRVNLIVFLPGTMGSNLKATSKNKGLKPGQPAWRPPNGKIEGGAEVWKWQGRDSIDRQNILDPDGVEVDDSGKVVQPPGWLFNDTRGKERGWGTVHWQSYGGFLAMLEETLNSTFAYSAHKEQRVVEHHWQDLMKAKRDTWDAADMPPLTEDDLLKYCKYQYPVYAIGYNWLASNEQAAQHVKKRIEEIIAWWRSRGHQCDSVIIVTHSMGGLVGRAVAKLIPEKVLGVIHGVMPAIGTPLAYRRIACGTEISSPSAEESMETRFFADIVGRTAAETMPVMGAAPGVLELLPNHRYPERWLKLCEHGPNNTLREIASLPEGDPYAMYRDFKSWYRLLDLSLCDPAKRYADKIGGISGIITQAINQAERFHKKILDEYYHPNTYAFYGEDGKQMTYGNVRWAMHNQSGKTLTPEQIKSATPLDTPDGESRYVKVEGHGQGLEQNRFFKLQAQDAKGDGTVAPKSGAAPKGKPGVKRVFKTQGYDHQGSFNNESMALLTKYLIAKMVAEKAKA